MKHRFTRLFFQSSIWIAIAFAQLSCSSEGPIQPSANFTESQLIDSYLAQNNIQATSTSTGLRYIILSEGEGPFATLDHFVSFYFRGYNLSNQVFSSNSGDDTPATLAMNNPEIIPGLIEGLTYFNKGASGSLFMPSTLAFGVNGNINGTVQPNSPIIYDITVTDVFTLESKHQDNIAEIEQYLEDNGLEAERTESDLFYIVEVEGDGEHPTIENSVTVDYHGYLTNGEVFDSSRDRALPATFTLSNVIAGWQEGIPLLSRGGKGILLIPNDLAYGDSPPPASIIPQYAVLIFEVELLAF